MTSTPRQTQRAALLGAFGRAPRGSCALGGLGALAGLLGAAVETFDTVPRGR